MSADQPGGTLKPVTPARVAEELLSESDAKAPSIERRLQLVAKYSTGFVYLVSRSGVTGERESLSDAVAPLV